MKNVFFSLLTFLCLVGCGGSDEDRPLRILTSPDNPPFEYKDTAKGGDQVIGFDMDLARAIGEKMGRSVDIIEMDFGGLIPALQAGRGDMIIAGVSATDERRKSVDFSNPYLQYSFALLMKEGTSIDSEKDLAHKKVGTQLGSSLEQVAQTLAENTAGMQVKSLNRVGEIVQELKNGRIDAILIEESVAKQIATQSKKGLKVVVLDLEGEAPAVVFPKGSDLVQPVNKAISELEEEGVISKLAQKWLDR